MFSIKTIFLPSGDVYDVRCFSQAFADEVYQAALELDATPHVEEDGDPCMVAILYADEITIDAIVITARDRFDLKAIGAVMEAEIEEMPKLTNPKSPCPCFSRCRLAH